MLRDISANPSMPCECHVAFQRGAATRKSRDTHAAYDWLTMARSVCFGASPDETECIQHTAQASEVDARRIPLCGVPSFLPADAERIAGSPPVAASFCCGRERPGDSLPCAFRVGKGTAFDSVTLRHGVRLTDPWAGSSMQPSRRGGHLLAWPFCSSLAWRGCLAFGADATGTQGSVVTRRERLCCERTFVAVGGFEHWLLKATSFILQLI